MQLGTGRDVTRRARDTSRSHQGEVTTFNPQRQKKKKSQHLNQKLWQLTVFWAGEGNQEVVHAGLIRYVHLEIAHHPSSAEEIEGRDRKAQRETHTQSGGERESQPAEESVRVMRIWGRHQKNTGQQEAMQPPPPPPPAKCARFSLVHVGIKPALRAGRAPAERARRDRENTCLARCVFSSEKGNVL